MFGTLKSQVQILPLRFWESTLVGEHDGVRDGSIPSFGNGGSNPPFPTMECNSVVECCADNAEVVSSNLTIPIPVREMTGSVAERSNAVDC